MFRRDYSLLLEGCSEKEGKGKMLELGKVQSLKVVKRVEFGAYLASLDGYDEEERVLLPLKQVPPYTAMGDEVEVFLYKDSKDRIIATTRVPIIQIGTLAVLRVKEVGAIGAFLDWGLEKDLLLPFKQMNDRVKEGKEYLVTLYVDKSERLCATMDVYKYLDCDSPYKKDDEVQGIVYQVSPEYGAYVAVDAKYSARIPQKELYGPISVGDQIKARVTQVKEDGKLDLSLRQKAYMMIETDAVKILELLEEYHGALPFTDKADPERIREVCNMSKNEFKRAVGNLLKNGKIEILESEIRLK